jgi:hypothetical protein
MRDYRLYFLDGEGRVEKAHEFLAETDSEAIKTAEAWREGRPMELWNHARKIRSWGCEGGWGGD